MSKTNWKLGQHTSKLPTYPIYHSSTIYGQTFRWTAAAAVARGVKPAIINRVFFSTVRPVGLFFISLAMKVFLTPKIRQSTI